MIIVGLTGHAGSGKDTVADYLVENHGFQKFPLAADLKRMLTTLDPFLDDSGTRLSHILSAFDGDLPAAEDHLKKWFGEYRRLLQTLGTECVRERDPHFWIYQLLDQLPAIASDARVVVPDCRFPNELDSLEKMYPGETHFWQVIRPNLPKQPGNAGNHSSENWAGHMGEAPLLNSGTREELYAEVDRYLAEAIAASE